MRVLHSGGNTVFKFEQNIHILLCSNLKKSRKSRVNLELRIIKSKSKSRKIKSELELRKIKSELNYCFAFGW